MDRMPDTSTLERGMIQRAKERKVPIMGSLELLPLCNMDCEMCYVRLDRKEMERAGRMRTAEEWLKIAVQMEQAGVLFLLLTGGEPLLFPEFQKLYLKLKEMGMILTINTNGTLIDRQWAEFFGKNKPRRINITLYGADAGDYERLCHYPQGFEKTVEAIRLLREQQVDVKVSISLTKINYNHMKQMFDIGEELGVPVHIDPYMMPAVRERTRPFAEQSRILPEEAARASLEALKLQLSEEYYRQYLQQSIEKVEHPVLEADRVSCLAGNCSFTVNWQGQLRPCVMLEGQSVSVFEKGFVKAWKKVSEGTQSLRIAPKCADCHLRSLCKICAAASRLETGSCDGVPDYLCRYTEELYRLIRQEAENEG